MKSRECLSDLFLTLFPLYKRPLLLPFSFSFALSLPYCPIFAGQTTTAISLSPFMTPVHLNPPHDSDPFQLAEEQKDDQHLHLLHSSSHNRAASSSVSWTNFQDQRMIIMEESQQHDQKARVRDLLIYSKVYYFSFLVKFFCMCFYMIS